MFAGSPADEADDFIARYLPDHDKPRPGLEDALQILTALPKTTALLAGLGSSCRALIQGYASHGNADALRRSLLASGVVHPRISAVDLLDLPEIFARLGLKMPQMDFVRADARDLRGWFGDGIFSLVAQDFLLNAAPPFQAADLLAEARRLLDPAGILVLSFTDSTCLEVLPAITRHGWKPSGVCIGTPHAPLWPNWGHPAITRTRYRRHSWIVPLPIHRADPMPS